MATWLDSIPWPNRSLSFAFAFLITATGSPVSGISSISGLAQRRKNRMPVTAGRGNELMIIKHFAPSFCLALFLSAWD
jgi:hypothetical protein